MLPRCFSQISSSAKIKEEEVPAASWDSGTLQQVAEVLFNGTKAAVSHWCYKSILSGAKTDTLILPMSHQFGVIQLTSVKFLMSVTVQPKAGAGYACLTSELMKKRGKYTNFFTHAGGSK